VTYHRKAWTLWKGGYALHLVEYQMVWFIMSYWNSYCGLYKQLIRLCQKLERKRPYVYWQKKVFCEIIKIMTTPGLTLLLRHYNESWDLQSWSLRIRQIYLSNYHLFHPMYALSDTHLQSVDEIRKWVDNFIVSKDTAFFSKMEISCPKDP